MRERARERMRKRAPRFVVGYIGTGNLVFGKASSFNGRQPTLSKKDSTDDGNIHTAAPMTRRHAEKLLDEMPCSNCAIFELVPVKVNR